MVKRMKKLFIFIMILLSINIVYAYENEYFDINIPNNYILETNSTNVYKWSKDSNYISVTVNNNKSNNISSYSKSDIDRELNIMKESYNDGLKEYNITVTIDNMKKEHINNKSVLIYDMYFPTTNSTGYDMYQKGLTLTTKNYVYTLIYSSDKEIDEDYFSNLINTFEVHDEAQIDYELAKVLITILFGLLMFLVSIVLIYKYKLKA